MNKLYKLLIWDFGRPSFDKVDNNDIIQRTDEYLDMLRARKGKIKRIVRVQKLVSRYFSTKDQKAKRRIERQIHAQH